MPYVNEYVKHVVNKQYNLVLVKGQLCLSLEGDRGHDGSNGSLSKGLRLSFLWIDCLETEVSSGLNARLEYHIRLSLLF